MSSITAPNPRRSETSEMCWARSPPNQPPMRNPIPIRMAIRPSTFPALRYCRKAKRPHWSKQGCKRRSLCAMLTHSQQIHQCRDYKDATTDSDHTGESSDDQTEHQNENRLHTLPPTQQLVDAPDRSNCSTSCLSIIQ